jgi:signal transduction histidine kinase
LGLATGGGTEAAAVVLAAVALLALAGWISGVPQLASWVAGDAAMRPITALCFLAAGVALAFEQRLHAGVATTLGWLVCGIGALSLAQDLTGIDLMVADWLAPRGAFTAAATATGLVCGGAAIALRRHPVWAPAAPVLAALAGLIGVAALLGYAYKIPGFGSLPTALGLIALSGGLLSHPELRWPDVQLRVVLGALVAGALLPAFVFMVSQARRATAERLAAVEHDGRDLADKAGVTVDRLLAGREGLIRGLAASPALKNGDLAAFYAQAKAAVSPGEGAVVVIDRQLHMRLNTALPFGAPLPAPAEREAAGRAFATGQLQLSGLFRFPVGQKPSVALTLPVAGTDFALRIMMRSEWVSGLLRQTAPQGWIIAIADRKGILAGRSRDPEKWVGGPASAPVWALARQSDAGWARSTSLEGLNIWLSWQRLSSGWTVLAYMDERHLDRIAREQTQSLSLAALIVTLLGLLFAALAATAIGRPLARLSAAAQAFGRGEVLPPLVSHIREIDGVIAALDAGARARNAAETKLRGEIAQRKSAEQELERTRALAAVSHDLRTPLTRLKFRLEDVQPAATATAMAADIEELEEMIDATLSYLRGENSGEEARAIDLAALLETIASDAADRGLDVSVSGPRSLVVFGRRLGLKRAFANIVQNALKYGVRAQISMVAVAERAQVQIDDEGPGIPDDKLSAVLEPFVRLEDSRSRETGGAGLGLAIAKANIEADGGTLSLSNRPQGGLRVIATLPLAKASGQVCPGPAA